METDVSRQVTSLSASTKLGGLLVVSTAVRCVCVCVACAMHLTSSRVIGPLSLAALTSLSTSLCLAICIGRKRGGMHDACSVRAT